MENKFVIGDKVKVVGYGHLFWLAKDSEMKTNFPIIHKEGDIIWHDMNSGVVGKKGVVDKVTETQGQIKYSIKGIPEKSAWYNEEQLKMVKANPNRD